MNTNYNLHDAMWINDDDDGGGSGGSLIDVGMVSCGMRFSLQERFLRAECSYYSKVIIKYAIQSVEFESRRLLLFKSYNKICYSIYWIWEPKALIIQKL